MSEINFPNKYIYSIKFSSYKFRPPLLQWRGRRGRDRMVVDLCNRGLLPLTLWVWIPLRRGVLDTTLCDKVCQSLATGQWFSPQ